MDLREAIEFFIAEKDRLILEIAKTQGDERAKQFSEAVALVIGSSKQFVSTNFEKIRYSENMVVQELIELLKRVPKDDIIAVDLEQGKRAYISDVLVTSDILIGNGSISGISYLKIESYED